MPARRRLPRHAVALAAAAACLLAVTLPAGATGLLPVDPPVLGPTVPRGTSTTVTAEPITPTADRTLDGQLDDWVGEPSWYGGTLVTSAGELIYTDHLFDATGADDGEDARRYALTGALEGALPEAYRIEAIFKANLAGQVGVPNPPGMGMSDTYGDLPYRGAQDLVELRLATDDEHVWVLARTAELTEDDRTGVLLLLGGGDGGPQTEVPFGAGITTSRATTAVLLAGDVAHVADLATGTVETLPQAVATNPDGFTNAIEARLPRALFERDDLHLTAALGALDETGTAFADTGLGANLANVAFRLDEPVREWFDLRQALALHAGDIDEFLLAVDLGLLDAGTTERSVPGPGYHDRIFLSTTPGLAQERSREGERQHYGVFLPSAIADLAPDGVLPLQWWLHWRGGTAHVGAMVSPGIFRHMGEDRGGIVVSPRGRGTSTWYVGRGHADLLEVWDDVLATFPVDEDRTYVSGHSMGGWGSYLLSVLYPDRFAAALPVAGPVTQGAWTGLDLPGCDDFTDDDYSPCYIQANGGDARAQHTRRMLDNLRNVPIGMYYAAADELVPISGATRQHERLLELGYRHRFYVFPAHEHYTHPIVDEWAHGVDYLDRFTRDENPHRVTYIRDLAFERSVNEVNAGGITFGWTFDSAYWMQGLEVADGAERARVDATSHAKPAPPRALPDAGGPLGLNQVGPFVYTGLQWLATPLDRPAELRNAFSAALEGAEAVELDLDRMDLAIDEPLTGTVTSDVPVTLRLAAGWLAQPEVRVDGQVVPDARRGRALELRLPAGTSIVEIDPR
jgi:hypothetical protein